MRLLLVADGSSPHTWAWVEGAAQLASDMLVLSSRSVDPPDGLPAAVQWAVPGATPRLRTRLAPTFRATGSDVVVGTSPGGFPKVLLRHLVELAVAQSLARTLDELDEKFAPDIVHCLRLPWEGIAGCGLHAPRRPTAISLWGSDLVTQAPSTQLLGSLSRQALSRASGVIADCRRDVDLARQWGLPPHAPTAIVPGNFGLDPGQPSGFAHCEASDEVHFLSTRGTKSHSNWVAVLRGLAELRDAGVPARLTLLNAETSKAAPLVTQLGLDDRVELHGHVSRPDFVDWLTWADTLISPTFSDGLPVSLLEGMAAGCFIIAGDLESLRDVLPGPDHGVLVDPANDAAIARAMLVAASPEVRARAAAANPRRVRETYSRETALQKVDTFYRSLPESA